MFLASDEILNKAEDLLKKNCPSPEGELIRLSHIAANLPGDETGARIRALLLDIDYLIAQARWNLGQALLLIELYPQIVDNTEPSDPIEKIISENEMPSTCLLLLRGYVAQADKIFYSDLSQPRRNGTVAGWLYHMMIDDAIYRVIAALDRLAQIIWLIAKLPKENVYFRSGKMAKINNALKNKHSKKLLDIASGELLKYVIRYRDGFSHEMKVYSKAAGTRPNDEWIGSNGNRFVIKHDKWEADTLFALANATYHQLTDALKPTIEICDKFLKGEENDKNGG
jgi:hypothetical protein